MNLVEQTTVPDAALPVASFKDHLRLGSGFSDDGIQDELLDGYLRAAMAAIEARTNKILITRNFDWTLAGWAAPTVQPLPLAPVSAVTDVTLISTDGVETPLDPSAWRLEQDQHRPRLLSQAGRFPNLSGGVARIGLEAGFGAAWDNLPADLAQAVMLLAAHFYEFRHDLGRSDPHLPPQVQALITPHRSLRLFMGSRS